MASLSSAIIIISFFLLTQARTAAPGKAKAGSFWLSANVVVVSESSAGKIVIAAKVKMESPGYVVVHEGRTGSPGAVLGYSRLLPRGEAMDVVVGLGREISDGEILYAMLHLDNWDGEFDAKTDFVALDNLGNPAMMKFEVGTAVEGTSLILY